MDIRETVIYQPSFYNRENVKDSNRSNHTVLRCQRDDQVLSLDPGYCTRSGVSKPLVYYCTFDIIWGTSGQILPVHGCSLRLTAFVGLVN